MKRRKIDVDEKSIDLSPIMGVVSFGSLSMKSIDPLTRCSFGELIQAQADRAYILAFVLHETGGFQCVDGLRLQKGLMKSTEMKVDRVYYFTLSPGSSKFTYLSCCRADLADHEKQLLDVAMAGGDVGEACYKLGCDYFLIGGEGLNFKVAAQYYLRASQHGYLLGTYMWAKCLRDGLGIPADPVQEAKVHLKLISNISDRAPTYKALMALASKDAEQGDLFAKYLLGVFSAFGIGVQKDVKNAFAIFCELAKQGYAPALHEKSSCLLNGGTTREAGLLEGVEALTLAATKAYPPAQYSLGKLLLVGCPYIEMDVPAGIALIKKAAEQDFSFAELWLIEDMMVGKHQPCDPKRAFERLATAEANNGSLFLLARCYIEGIGTAKDMEKGVHLCTISANQGHGRANHLLGKCKEKGLGVAMDLEGAAGHYLLATKKGCHAAFSDLGRCYQYGIGVAINLEAALQNYTIGAGKNCPVAQRLLALCLIEERGIAKNDIAAVSLLSKASAQNDAIAINELGYCYQHGIGTHQRPAEAVMAFAKAAELGLPEAQVNLGFCYLKGIGGEMNLYKAAALFEKAAAHGLANAEYNLALCKLYGWGCAEDLKAANALFKSAAEKGHAGANIMLLWDGDAAVDA